MSDSFGIFQGACIDGDLETVKKEVENGLDLKHQGEIGLDLACFGGHLEIIKFLHKSGVNLDSPDAVSSAVEKNRFEILVYLHENGARIENIPENEELVLHACAHGSLKILKYLIEKTYLELDLELAFETAGVYGKVKILKYLENWYYPTREVLNRTADKALRTGSLKTVKYLLALGAEIPKKGVISGATSRGHLEVVKFLVETGVNKRELNDALGCASRNEHLEIVKFLLSKGGDFSRLIPEHKTYFRTLKAWRRWRIKIFLRKLFRVALPLYYSPGFPGSLKGKISLEEFVGEMKQ